MSKREGTVSVSKTLKRLIGKREIAMSGVINSKDLGREEKGIP